MLAEKFALTREVGHRHIVTGDQVAHHLAQAGHMVFGLGHGVVACQAQRGQVGAQARQRLFVEEAAQKM